MEYSKKIINMSTKKGFTLVELIIVIIIVGILASLGLTQYNLVVEKSRIAEAKVNVGVMRKVAYEYYLQNGTFLTLTNADLGVGTDSDLFPQNCNTNHYFHYGFDWPYQNQVNIWGYRCTSGGKSPNWGAGSYAVYITSKPDVGDTGFTCWAPDDSCSKVGLPH
jgi:prepilin-type N-terminal cleavage/methylation domain-containing protein